MWPCRCQRCGPCTCQRESAQAPQAMPLRLTCRPQHAMRLPQTSRPQLALCYAMRLRQTSPRLENPPTKPRPSAFLPVPTPPVLASRATPPAVFSSRVAPSPFTMSPRAPATRAPWSQCFSVEGSCTVLGMRAQDDTTSIVVNDGEEPMVPLMAIMRRRQ